MNKKYYISTTASTMMKGSAIICVLLAHLLNYRSENDVEQIANFLGTGGVWIFLLLSGYGLWCSYIQHGIDKKRFWVKKLDKVFLPYMIITFVYYVLLQMLGNSLTVYILVKNFLCIDYARSIDGTMWYMSFLLLWYSAFFVIFVRDISNILKIVILFFCGYIFWGGYCANVFDGCTWQFSVNAYAFPLGVVLGFIFNKLDKIERFIANEKSIVFLTIGAAILYIIGFVGVTRFSYGQMGVILFILIYGIVRLLEQHRAFVLLEWIGKKSYLIYLIEGKCFVILSRVQIENDFAYCFIFIVVLGVLVAVSEYIGKFLRLKRITLRKYIKNC